MIRQEKKRWKTIIGSLLLAVILLFPASSAVYAQELGHVFDDALLLTDEELQSVSDEVDALEEETGWTVYAVTTDDTEGKSSETFADDFFDERTEADTDGVVLLLDMDNRQVYVSTAGDAIRYLTDSRIDQITENAASEAGNSAYEACFEKLINGVSQAYDSGIPSDQYNYDTETGEISRYHSITPMEAVVALLLGCAAAAAVYGGIVGKYRLKFGTYHYDGHRDGKIDLTVKQDRLVDQFVTHHRIQRDNGSSGGGGSRSSTHTSSSGRSHGGGGHGF